MAKKKQKKKDKWRLFWLGFFMMFPIMFFGEQLRETVWFDVFGVMSLVGAGILVWNFMRIVRGWRGKWK